MGRQRTIHEYPGWVNIPFVVVGVGLFWLLGFPVTDAQREEQESYRRAIAPIVQITTANGTQDIKVRGIHRYWNGMVRVEDWNGGVYEVHSSNMTYKTNIP